MPAAGPVLDEAQVEAVLLEKVRHAQGELETKDAELLACRHALARGGGAAAGVREELALIHDEAERLERRLRAAELGRRAGEGEEAGFAGGSAPSKSPKETGSASGGLKPSLSSSMGGSAAAVWRARVVALEDELRAKSELVTRLRRRELWLEHQLRRQADVNAKPLEALADEARQLQRAMCMQTMGRRSTSPDVQASRPLAATSSSAAGRRPSLAARAREVDVRVAAEAWSAPTASIRSTAAEAVAEGLAVH